MSHWIYRHPFRFLALLAAAAMLPAFIFGPFGSDLLYHTVWTQEFSYEFLHGSLYPRWLSRMNSGCGDPVFFSYYPLPYYLSLPFSFLDTGNGWYPLAATITLYLFLSGGACFVWLCGITRDRTAILCGSVFYMLAPTTFYLIYGMIALTGISFFMFTPLLIHFGGKIADRAPHAIPAYACCMAGLYTSSIPGTVAAAWLPVCYCLFAGYRNKALAATAVKLAAAIMLGTALAAFYLLPMLATKDMHYGIISAGATLHDAHFMFFTGEEAPIYMVHLYTLLLVSGLGYRLIRSYQAPRQEIFFWMMVACLTFFMMLHFSEFLWKLFPVLDILAFPYRFGHAILPLVFSLFLTRYLSAAPNPRIVTSLAALLIIFVPLCSISLAITGHTDPSLPQAAIPEESGNILKMMQVRQSKLYAEKRMLDGIGIPSAVPQEWINGNDTDKLHALCKRRTRVESGNAIIAVSDWRSRHITLEVDAATESTLTVSQFYFPGWTAREGDITYPVTPAEEGGILRFTVPPGKHNILLELETYPSERYGTFISFITLCILLGMVVYSRGGGTLWISANSSKRSA